MISIHAPHTGRDQGIRLLLIDALNFNPRAPYGARHLIRTGVRLLQAAISIHAPHTGRDLTRMLVVFRVRISIHAPHTGRDDGQHTRHCLFTKFQSTRPIRGATLVLDTYHVSLDYFNPRAPYGARQCTSLTLGRNVQFQSTRPIRGATLALGQDIDGLLISIHAPHTGRDGILLELYLGHVLFQSTRPIRGATCWVLRPRLSRPDFNPRAPYGARPRTG